MIWVDAVVSVALEGFEPSLRSRTSLSHNPMADCRIEPNGRGVRLFLEQYIT